MNQCPRRPGWLLNSEKQFYPAFDFIQNVFWDLAYFFKQSFSINGVQL